MNLPVKRPSGLSSRGPAHVTCVGALLAALLAAIALLAGCATSQANGPEFSTPTYTKPGVALAKQSCSCLACVSLDACVGRAPLARDEQECEGGFRIDQSTRFEAKLTACQPSCFRRAWSVSTEARCDDEMPEDCCPQ